jgi:hypothetical protein
MNFIGVFEVLQLTLNSMRTAEDFISGYQKGNDKKCAVLKDVQKKLGTFKKTVDEAVPGTIIAASQFGWLTYVDTDEEFRRKLGLVVDTVVDLSKYLDQLSALKPNEVIKPTFVN